MSHLLTLLLVSGYVGACEFRAPTPWKACESRWNWAMGVLVPSPLTATAAAIRRRRRAAGGPPQPQAPTFDT